MKISIHSDRIDLHVAGSLYVAVMQTEHELVAPNKADLVINVDSIHNTGLKRGKKTVYWELDDNLHRGNNKQFYDVDQLYIVSKARLDLYPKGTKVLPVAAEPTIHYKWKEFDEVYDLVFIGSDSGNEHYNYRREILDQLQYRFFMHRSKCEPQNYPKELSKGKILLNINPHILNDPPLIVTRFFESMAIGCLLNDYHSSLDEFAVEGRDYIGFYDLEDAIAKTHYFLVHPEERARIAKNGRKNILANHTWKHRLETIIEGVSK